MSPIRVLVVEDSLTVRERLIEVLSADAELTVIGQAADAPEAVELCRRLRPDVLTLDMVLRASSGLQVTEQVMAWCPTPILVVSSSLERGEAHSTFHALAAGAVDVLDKPRAEESAAGWERRLVSAVKRVSRIKVISHLRGRLDGLRLSRPPAAALPPVLPRTDAPRVVGLGASTGGPGALAELLRDLPATFPLPILITLHIAAPFGQSFVDWLDDTVPLPVRMAEDGPPLPPPGRGCVFVAPPERHLLLSEGRLRLSDAPERHSCRPSVDVLFESLASELGPTVVAALLTGMGRDGAAGLLAIQRAGGRTLAQDEATSVVFGMPREAVQLGAAGQVLPLGQLAPTIRSLVEGGSA